MKASIQQISSRGQDKMDLLNVLQLSVIYQTNQLFLSVLITLKYFCECEERRLLGCYAV
jgi:hypothetical protein